MKAASNMIYCLWGNDLVQTEEKYKLSRYNAFYRDGGDEYIWNTYSNALLKLDENAQGYVRSFPGKDDRSNEFSLLKNNGFAVHEQIDEYRRVYFQERQAMFNQNANQVGFVIAPGLGCNYNCGYCFEANSNLNGVMTPEIAEDTAEYICKQLKNNVNARELKISWFGGEPLLYLDKIETISRRIIEYSQQNNLAYEASIITNGRYLDANTLSKLKELRIEKAQVTVDGTQNVYCISKGASPDDFHHVMDNIRYAADKIKLSIRLNIPDNDVNEAVAITEYLLSQNDPQDKTRVYMAFVRDYSLSAEAADQSYSNFVHNYTQWLDRCLEVYKDPIKSGLVLPRQVSTSCGLIRAHNSCIGPLGELYKCEHCFGIDSMITGDIWRGRYYNEAELAFCSTIDTPAKSQCRQCEYLPICMGGCANDRVYGLVNPDCEAYKRLQFKLKLLEGGVNI